MRSRSPEYFDLNPRDTRGMVLDLISWIDSSHLKRCSLKPERDVEVVTPSRNFGKNFLRIIESHSQNALINLFAKGGPRGPEYTIVVEPFFANVPTDLKFLAACYASKEILRDSRFSSVCFKCNCDLPKVDGYNTSTFFRRIFKPDNAFLVNLEALKNRVSENRIKSQGERLDTFLTGDSL